MDRLMDTLSTVDSRSVGHERLSFLRTEAIGR
jgi:hypothetical protein